MIEPASKRKKFGKLSMKLDGKKSLRVGTLKNFKPWYKVEFYFIGKIDYFLDIFLEFLHKSKNCTFDNIRIKKCRVIKR